MAASSEQAAAQFQAKWPGGGPCFTKQPSTAVVLRRVAVVGWVEMAFNGRDVRLNDSAKGAHFLIEQP